MAHILLIVSGGIAAYKACEFVRLARKANHRVTPILTAGGAEFITPLSLAALAESPVYQNLFDLKDETEMGHIRLAREADLIVIAPASANMIAKMTQGLADDLATTLLLAADIPVLIAPAMNPMMWTDPATQDNIKTLKSRGIHQIGPDGGDMACGEIGEGRLAEPAEILAKAEAILSITRPLAGFKAIVTSGPTHEPLDPVRYIGNRSSGKQGHAIAFELARAGAGVTLVSGPVALPDPEGVTVIAIDTAQQMSEAVHNALPADIFVGAAAVADWMTDALPEKHKKTENEWTITLRQTPDILASVAASADRPRLVIGFALESENMMENARAKRARKAVDALLVNAIAADKNPFGADSNRLIWIDAHTEEDWGQADKNAHAHRLTKTITTIIKGEI